MIQMGTIIKVIDNSGVKRVRCINLLGSSQRDIIGEKIIAAVYRVKTHRKVRQGSKVKCYVVGVKRWFSRFDGRYIRFSRNSVMVLNKRGEPLGSRVRGPVLREFRDKIEVRTLGVTIRTV